MSSVVENQPRRKAKASEPPAPPPAWYATLREVMQGLDYSFPTIHATRDFMAKHGTVKGCPGVELDDVPVINGAVRRFDLTTAAPSVEPPAVNPLKRVGGIGWDWVEADPVPPAAPKYTREEMERCVEMVLDSALTAERKGDLAKRDRLHAMAEELRQQMLALD